ncbi:MAG: hypothetical protein NT029_07630 [Armatimonadetes bacterium]|nr:hypothetical protein [Armatimonadota bacterium]
MLGRPEAPDDQQIRRLVRRMRSWRRPVREAAAAELAELGPDAINAVHRQFQQITSRPEWRMIMAMSMILCVQCWFHVTGVRLPVWIFPAYMGVNALGTVASIRAGLAWAVLASAATKLRWPGQVSVLLDACVFGSQAPPAVAALADALAAADAGDLAQLDNRCMARVRSLMANSQDRRLVMALLELCAEVGDSRELRAVRGLCRKGKVLSAACSGDPEVNQAAERARAAIEARLAATPEARRLVRPAAAPSDGSAILLRPAHSVPVGDEDRLLRPVGAEANEAAPATDSAEAEQASVGQEQRGGG